MSHFIESISFINGVFKNIEIHNKRINKTHKNYFNLSKDIFLEKEILIPKGLEKNTLYKCRIVYAENIEEISFIPYHPKKIDSICLVYENQINYDYKFKDRTLIENHLQQSNCDEIILVKNEFITDSSYSNLIFFDGKQWITPKNCLLNGVQRQFLLQNNKIIEKEITVNDLQYFSHFKLINALLTIENSAAISTSIIKKD